MRKRENGEIPRRSSLRGTLKKSSGTENTCYEGRLQATGERLISMAILQKRIQKGCRIFTCSNCTGYRVRCRQRCGKDFPFEFLHPFQVPMMHSRGSWIGARMPPFYSVPRASSDVLALTFGFAIIFWHVNFQCKEWSIGGRFFVFRLVP